MNKIRLLLIYTALPLFCAMIFGSPAYGQGGGNAQKRTVSGMVTDENDNPVSGATVIVQGTTTGTTTTAGKFTIHATPASVLEVKFLGYKTAEVKVGTQTNLAIKLETTSETIQDVVVTALGMTRERKSLGYSVGRRSVRKGAGAERHQLAGGTRTGPDHQPDRRRPQRLLPCGDPRQLDAHGKQPAAVRSGRNAHRQHQFRQCEQGRRI